MTVESSGTGASFSMDDFAKALDQYDYDFKRGQTVRGTVYEYTGDGAYVDIGGKSSGFVPTREAALEEVDDLTQVLPSDQEIEFMIIREQNSEGQVTLSRRQLEIQAAWERVAEMAESGKSAQIRINRTNKGGVIGEVEGLRGFIPRSHLEQRDNLDSLIGQLLTATFLEVNPEENKLVMSQRDAIRATAINKMTEGILVEGRVASIKPYGVFVDFQGVSGLLHISQVSGASVDSLNTLFSIGQSIKAMIAHIDEYRNRIALSTKVLENYPGEILENFDEMMAEAESRETAAKGKLEQSNQ